MRFNIPCLLAVSLTAAIPALAQSPAPPSQVEQNIVSDLQMLTVGSNGERRLQSDLFAWKTEMEGKMAAEKAAADKREKEWGEYSAPLWRGFAIGDEHMPAPHNEKHPPSAGPPVK